MALGSTSDFWVHNDASTGGDKDRSVQGCMLTHTHRDVHTLQLMVIRPSFSRILFLTPAIYDLTNKVMKILSRVTHYL